MRTRMSLPRLALLAALVGGQAGRSQGACADEGKSTTGARGPESSVAAPVASSAIGRPDGGPATIAPSAGVVPVPRPTRRDRSFTLARAVFHPRVARLARQLDESRDVADAADAARRLLRLDSEVARDAVASYAARSPLRAYDREHGVLVLLDGTGGWYSDAVANPTPPVESPSEMTPEVRRQLNAATAKAFDGIRSKMGTIPPVPWAAAHRLPDGAVTPDEGGGGDSVSFLMEPRDGKSYHYLTYKFRGRDLEMSWIRDVKDDQLRRWRASSWWPQERR